MHNFVPTEKHPGRRYPIGKNVRTYRFNGKSCDLKENFHCPALRGKPTDPQTIRLILECNTRGCSLAKEYILDNPRDVFDSRFVGSVDHDFGKRQDAPLILVHDSRMVKA